VNRVENVLGEVNDPADDLGVLQVDASGNVVDLELEDTPIVTGDQVEWARVGRR